VRTSLPLIDDARRRPAPPRAAAPSRPNALALDDGPGSAALRRALGLVLDGLRRHRAGGDPIVFSLRAPDPGVAAGLVAALGEGEVSVTIKGSRPLSIVETVLAGLWRIEGELLEVADVPSVVRAANARATRVDLDVGAAPPGAMNVMPLLEELRHRARSYRPGDPNHVVSLTLLPMNDVDLAYLDDRLGSGPVVAESSGYGQCRVALTAHRHIWSVQHRNGLGGVLLDTIEVGDVPAALCAAEEDVVDSAERLAELLGV
jgi:hydrogenase-1 operon protein HyaF